MSLITNNSSHWYTLKGEPAYTRTTKAGGIRNTTLADAKKEGLLPSVTTILKVLAKPELENWKQEQAIMSALTLPRNEGESLEDFAKRVVTDMNEQSRSAADFGTTIHNVLENYFKDGTVLEKYSKLIEDVQSFLDQMGWTIHKVEGVAIGKGYAGKFDLVCKDKEGKYWIVDYKTQTYDTKKSPTIYDEWLWQLGAYANSRDLKDNIGGACNIVINRQTMEVRPTVYNTQEVSEGFKAFETCLSLWSIVKNFDPRTL